MVETIMIFLSAVVLFAFLTPFVVAYDKAKKEMDREDAERDDENA